jgi:hypothetical protein
LSKARIVFRLLLLFVVALQAPAFAQPATPWPCNATTNRIEFRGHLSWPDSIKSAEQQQALVRRWYRRGLTNESAMEIRRMIKRSGAAYAGLPQESCYTHGIAGVEHERFRLYFHLTLIPDSTGLTYLLSDFECIYIASDVGTEETLEDALKMPDARVQAVMEGFHRRLRSAFKGWN